MYILPPAFYARDTVTVAQELLGSILIRSYKNSTISGMIVETEAYCTPDDPACHAFKRETASNTALYGPSGHAYIYFIYGNHYCFNTVAHSEEQAAGGVLIRALEPLQGIEHMKQSRKTDILHNLTNGPGKLTQALNITKELYGINVTKKGELYIVQGNSIPAEHIKATPRIGISQATEKLWRFYITNNSFVSKR